MNGNTTHDDGDVICFYGMSFEKFLYKSYLRTYLYLLPCVSLSRISNIHINEIHIVLVFVNLIINRKIK